MIIALLLVLGVNLVVVLALGVAVLGRRRWVKRQKGVFAGKIRVVAGDVDGLSPKWKGGFGHWVGGVLVWTRAPLLLRKEVISVDRLVGQRQAAADDGKRLGKDPVVIQLLSGTATIEVAAQSEDRALVVGALATGS
jgi:Protein of unknown function (DUF2550)